MCGPWRPRARASWAVYTLANSALNDTNPRIVSGYMRTVIVGCGRVGSSLARQLSEEGDDVAVVDSSEAAFNRLGEDFAGEMVFGSAGDEEILRRAGTDRAEAFVAVTNADTTNIMAAQLAQHEFGVKKVICRIYDPARADLYAELGIETLCPTTVGAEKVKRLCERGGSRRSRRPRAPSVAASFAATSASGAPTCGATRTWAPT